MSGPTKTEAWRDKAMCSKCGSSDIHTVYVEAGGKIDDVGPYKLNSYTENECLRRRCRHCKYWWTTLTLDSQEVSTT